ncbi:MAG: hypothetical protein JST84_09335 [Acidobacteria bacterium]|nr:hypothetical protein [Acidobacteriota bacterium]
MNHWSLIFPTVVDYHAHDEITAEVILVHGAVSVKVDAKLDTGSKFCIFQPGWAAWLGLDLYSGVLQHIRTAAGSFPAYGHEVILKIGDLEWQTTIFFAEPENFPINVVGRIGFLDRLQVGLVDYEQLLYLGPYEA